MQLLFVTFVVVLGTMLGAYWLFIVRPEDQSKGSAIQRLKKYKPKTFIAGVVRPEERLSHIKTLESLLQRRAGLVARVRALLTEADVNLTVGGFMLTCFAAGTLGGAIGWAVLHMMVVAVALGAAFAAAPYVYVRFKRGKRLRIFEEQFPEAMDLISRALRAGHAFTTGIGMVADEIPAPVGSEFRRLYDEQNFGMSLQDAMHALALRVPVLDARFFVTAVLTQRESGGNLSEILDNLSGVMRERFKLKRHIRVISAHGRISAWILAALPPVLAAVLFMLSPKFMEPLITDPLGINLVLIAGTLQIVGTYIISRMIRIEY